MTNAQFDTWVAAATQTLTTADAADSAASWGLTATTAYILGFQRFYCPTITAGSFTCYKWQPLTSTDGNPRFDTDSTNVKAYYFNDNDQTLTDEDFSVLAGAQTLLAGLTAAAALLMSF